MVVRRELKNSRIQEFRSQESGVRSQESGVDSAEKAYLQNVML
jgi:hypothetical protein